MEDLGLNSDFWRGKRVFVTGHTGFKGGWLTIWLKRLGADVTGFALEPPTVPSLFEAADVAAGVDSVIGDIRDYDNFSKALRQAHPEAIFHLAAQPLVRESYEDPINTYATNVMGTVHLMTALRDLPSCRSILVITSDKCYDNREWDYPYRETDPLGGYDPYSSSKACTELVTQAFRSSYFTSPQSGTPPVCVGTARAGNVVGGGDWAKDRLMTDAIRALSSGEDILVRNPDAVRPWQHVLEPLYGYLRWMERSFEDDAQMASHWNFGPSSLASKPVSWVVERVCKLWGGGTGWTLDVDAHPHEVQQLRLDSSRAGRRLKWRGRLDVEQALEWTVEWFRAFNAGEPVRQMCETQIARYEGIVGEHVD